MQGQEKNSDSRLRFRLFSYLCRRSCILELNLRWKKSSKMFWLSKFFVVILQRFPSWRLRGALLTLTETLTNSEAEIIPSDLIRVMQA